ncbi:hypothetical protein ACFS32_20420 [Novosphingobium pokkalii]|uniref:hypothetical protein n=1 Tax=Novosphingobium pokkalii TaxID=1770194 RepID=UPI00362B8F4C
MTDRVCYTYARAFLQHMASEGQFGPGTAVALAGDLRPSTPRIMAACAAAVSDAGGVVVDCGFVPSPAVAAHGFALGVPSLMVTGSHIPDDRNGIKFNRADGEVLKPDETAIKAQDVAVDESLFDADGQLLAPPVLDAPVDVGTAYVARYAGFFGSEALKGLKLGVYQHSAVGRDIVVDVVRALGAEVVALGRSERFIPVDTEAVRPEDVVLAREWSAQYGLDAILSTDGDPIARCWPMKPEPGCAAMCWACSAPAPWAWRRWPRRSAPIPRWNCRAGLPMCAAPGSARPS